MTKQELVKFLSTVDKEHIDELVDILTDFGKGRLALNSTVKNVLIWQKNDNSPYVVSTLELLIDEFYKFYGNTLANQIGVNSVTYEKMVDYIYLNYILVDEIVALAKKYMGFSNLLNLGSSIQKIYNEFSKNHLNKPLREKELIIIKSCLSDNFMNLSFNERFNICNDFFKKKYKYISAVSATPFVGQVLSAVIGVKTLSDGADRITIPFIIQIIYLKHKYKTDNIIDDKVVNLILNESEEVVVSVQDYNEVKHKKFSEKLDKTNITALNQIVGNIPIAMIKNDTSNTNYAIVNIALDKLTPAKDGNGIRGMVHGYNENGHFGITENVRLYDSKGLDNLVNTSLLLGFASMVLAQKHLADISWKLDEIKLVVSKISQFQQEDRESKIESAHEMLGYILNSVRNGYKIPQSEIPKFQNINTEISPIIRHLEKDLRNLSLEIQAIKFDAFLNRKNNKDLKALNDKFTKFRELLYQYRLCVDVITLVDTLLGYVSKIDNDILYYKDVDLQFIKKRKDFISKLSSGIENHLKYVEVSSKSITNFDSTDSANRAFFQSQLQELHFQNIFLEQKEEILNNFGSLGDVSIKVLLDDGEIIEGEILLD